MVRFAAVDPGTATGKGKELLDQVQARLGTTPNMMRAMANSPAVLAAYLEFAGALAAGTLPRKLREEIALAVGEANRCQYCLSAHTALGKAVGIREDEILGARRGVSGDARADAALQFARAILRDRGAVSGDAVDGVRRAGYTDGEIAEIVAAVALNVFTDSFNLVADTEIDFPRVPLAG